jgi:hypothetical protein
MFPLLLALTGTPTAQPEGLQQPQMPAPQLPGPVQPSRPMLVPQLPGTNPPSCPSCPAMRAPQPPGPSQSGDPTVSAQQPSGPSQSSCPTWNRYFKPAGDCAGPGLFPFQLQPRVCPVGVCDCSPQVPEKTVCHPWVKEFSCAAFIPYPRFDRDGRSVPGDGLIIYEGMQLTVDPRTGTYDLTFTATVPAMPVDLRLQLEFIKPCPGQETECYRLTLPPLRLEPKRDAKPTDLTAWTFHIAHRGYSTLFVEKGMLTNVSTDDGKCCPPLTIDCNWTVKRDAVARFGTPIAIDDPNRY